MNTTSLRFNEYNNFTKRDNQSYYLFDPFDDSENLTFCTSRMTYSLARDEKKEKKPRSLLSSLLSPFFCSAMHYRGSHMVLKLANRARSQLTILPKSPDLEGQVQDLQRALDDLADAYNKSQQELCNLQHAYKRQEQALQRKSSLRKKEQAQTLALSRDLSHEKAKRIKLTHELESMQTKLDDTKAEFQTLFFHHIPLATPHLQEIGPVQYDIVEEPSNNQVGDFHMGKTLGTGHFGKVVSGQHQHDSDAEQVAIKVLPKHQYTDLYDLQQLDLEIAILRQHGHHPNIIGLYQVLHAPENIYLVMEQGTMNLCTLMSKTSLLEDQQDLLRQLLLGILKPLEYLHSRGVCHLDIKPENILIKTFALDEEYQCLEGRRIEAKDVRLCDFGLTQVSDQYNADQVDQQAIPATNDNNNDGALCDTHDIIRLDRTCGTPGFFAPEMVIHEAFEGRTADMWSVGSCLLEMSFGHPSSWMESYKYFEEDNVIKFQESLENCLEEIQSSCEIHTDEAYLVHDLLVQELLQMDMTQRVTATQALQHPWFQAYQYY